MSSHSYSSWCPNCEKQMDSCSENRPFEHTDHWCPHCGFTAVATANYMDLESLNDYRKMQGLGELSKLPEQEFDYGISG